MRAESAAAKIGVFFLSWVLTDAVSGGKLAAERWLDSANHLWRTSRMHTVRYEVIVIMPLTMAPSGSANTVKKINGKDEIRHFLKSLGFVEGGEVTVVSEMGGNLIVNVKDTRIALSKGMAGRIMV